jgi:hypothetical protein
VSAPADQRWPGEHLGLPAAGPRSIARAGRRLAGIAIDWLIASGLSLAFFATGPWQTDPLVTLAIFAVLQVVPMWLLNGSIGHLLVGLRVVPLVPGRLAFWRPVVRTVLLCLFVPALIADADQRGLHDRAAGSLLVRV